MNDKEKKTDILDNEEQEDLKDQGLPPAEEKISDERAEDKEPLSLTSAEDAEPPSESNAPKDQAKKKGPSIEKGKLIKLIIAIAAIAAVIATVVILALTIEIDRDYDETEVLSAAAELINLAEPLNEIYYGKGLDCHESGLGIYRAARAESLEKYGISSVEELKAKTLEVFSEKEASLMFSAVLEPLQIDDKIKKYARYYDQKDDDGRVTFMVNSEYEYEMTNSIEYGSNITISDVEGEEIIISIPVTLKRITDEGEEKTKQTAIEVRMIETEEGWRFNDSCFAVYNEYTDILEELNK